MSYRNNQIENRQIRVFISSTFRDMQDERDYLMKRSFPKLKKLAAQRDVLLSELDLRWGITKEESESGKVVEICLKEIENSIPFFIGIIGNRYGWVPKKDDIGCNVIDQYEQVGNYLSRGLSVTEMEMQFGVLERQEDMHAFFYIKNSDQEEGAADSDNYEMLARLKIEVKNSRYPVESYSSAEDLAMMIESSFVELLNQLFPDETISEVEKVRIGQRSFMNQLCQSYVDDGKSFAILDSFLEDPLRQCLVVTGESGLGKSALIANWLKAQLSGSGSRKISYQFIGNGGNECSYQQVLRYLISDIRDIFKIEKPDGEDENDNLTKELEGLLSEVRNSGVPLLIVLDAINQIIDIESSKMLSWLPAFPENVKVIISTVPDDRTLSSLEYRHFEKFVVEPLNPSQRENLISKYLNLFGKSLNGQQIKNIIEDKLCSNTLILRTLLDEIICYGDFDTLDSRIDYYLGKNSIDEFYQSVIGRLEEDFGLSFTKAILSLISCSLEGLSEGEIMAISNTAPLYWSQFFGALENHLTSKNGYIFYSHNTFKEAVANRYLNDDKGTELIYRKNIIKYLEGSDEATEHAWAELAYQYDKVEMYEQLFNLLLKPKILLFFSKKRSDSLRSYWRRLIGKDPDRFSLEAYRGVTGEEADSEFYCRLLMFCTNQITNFPLAKEYGELAIKLLSNGSDKKTLKTRRDVLNHMGLFYFYKGMAKESKQFLEEALAIQKKMCPLGSYEEATYYNNLALVSETNKKSIELLEKGISVIKQYDKQSTEIYGFLLSNIGTYLSREMRLDEAEEYIHESISVRKAINGEHSEAICQSFLRLAELKNMRGLYKEAEDLMQKALSILEDLFGVYHIRVGEAYHNIGESYFHQSKLDDSLRCHKKELEIYTYIYGEKHSTIAQAWNFIGNAYNAKELYNEAECAYNNALSIYTSLYGEKSTRAAKIYQCLGSIAAQREDYGTARQYITRSIEINTKYFHNENCNLNATCYSWLANISSSEGDDDQALQYAMKSLNIRIVVFGEKHPLTGVSMGDIGTLYGWMGKYDKALEYSLKGLEIEKQFYGELHPFVATLYSQIGYIYSNMEDEENSVRYGSKAMEIKMKLSGQNGKELVGGLNNLGISYKNLGEYDEALQRINKALEINIQQNGIDDSTTAVLYDNIGDVYESMGCEDQALERQLKALEIRQRIFGEEHFDTSSSYTFAGNTYRRMGKYEESLKYLFKALEIRKKILEESNPALACAYNDIGATLGKMGKQEEAVDYRIKGLATAEKGGDTQTIATFCNRVAQAHLAAGHSIEAKEHFNRAADLFKSIGEEEDYIENKKCADELE